MLLQLSIAEYCREYSECYIQLSALHDNTLGYDRGSPIDRVQLQCKFDKKEVLIFSITKYYNYLQCMTIHWDVAGNDRGSPAGGGSSPDCFISNQINKQYKYKYPPRATRRKNTQILPNWTFLIALPPKKRQWVWRIQFMVKPPKRYFGCGDKTTDINRVVKKH